MGIWKKWRLVILLTLPWACQALVCNAGQAVQRSNGLLICETCQPGWYQPLPNVTEGVKCSMKSCPPEAVMVTNGTDDPTMDAECVCDTANLYYGKDYKNCNKREQCPTNRILTQAGECVCIDGRTENASGICVPVGTTSVGPTSVGTTGVSDNPVTQSQGLYALLVVPVVAVVAVAAVVVYRVQQSPTQGPSCV